MEKWEIIESKMVFDLPWYKVREDKVKLPNGKILNNYLVSVRDDFVITVPVLSDGKVIIIKQYKHGVQKFITEFPAGQIKKGEDPEIAAKRELKEETGYDAAKLTKLAFLHENPTKSTNSMHIYIAEGLQKTAEQELDDDGETEIEVKTVSLHELLQMVNNNEIETAPMVSAAMRALSYLGFIKEG